MKFAKRADVVIIAVFLLASLVSWFLFNHFSGDRSAKAEIYYYSELIKTLPLDGQAEQSFSFPQNPHVVFHLDGDGNIAFASSDCPDQVCVNTGNLHRAGEYAACLPNGFLLKIVPADGRGNEDADIIIGP